MVQGGKTCAFGWLRYAIMMVFCHEEEVRVASKDPQAVTLRLSKEEYEALRTFAFVTESSINEVARRALRDFLAAQGRREEFDALLKKARTQYRVALDKLADL